MRGMEETYGMGAGASVRKGKTAKQVRRARKAIDAKKKSATKTSSAKPEIRTNNTSSRKAYMGQKVKAPKKNLSSGGRFMQSADTRETVKRVYAKPNKNTNKKYR
jgi:hypothetical protein